MDSGAGNEVAMSAWVAELAHDLRSPLNAIVGMSELLLEPHFGPLSERQRDYVKDIKDGGGQLLRAIDTVAEVARVRSGRSPLELALVDPGDVVLAVADSRATCRAAVGPGTPPAVWGDVQKLQRALGALVDGAGAEVAVSLDVVPDGVRVQVEPACADPLRLGLARCLVEQHGGSCDARGFRLPVAFREDPS